MSTTLEVLDDTLRLYLESDAAAILKLRRSTLRTLRRNGTGPRWVRVGGKLVAYAHCDLATWLEGRKKGGGE